MLIFLVIRVSWQIRNRFIILIKNVMRNLGYFYLLHVMDSLKAILPAKSRTYSTKPKVEKLVTIETNMIARKISLPIIVQLKRP